MDTHSEVFPGFLLGNKQKKKSVAVLGKASKALVSVLGMMGCLKECSERAELSSLSNTKASENPLGAISGT